MSKVSRRKKWLPRTFPKASQDPQFIVLTLTILLGVCLQGTFLEKVKLNCDIQGDSKLLDEGMRLLTGVFLDFRGPQRLLWNPKDGRKLLLGTEDTFIG